MKYHYQFASKNSVRIELTGETTAEKKLLEHLASTTPQNIELLALYETALSNYEANVKLSSARFMNFPRVALCRYVVADVKVKKILPELQQTNSQLIFDF